MTAMNKKLFVNGMVKFLSGLIIVALPLFLSAGSFAYWNAWLFIGILFIPMFIAGLILMKKNPYLLEKRLNAKEEQSEQKSHTQNHCPQPTANDNTAHNRNREAIHSQCNG